MMRNLRNERGMALAIAIFALVVVGALVAGAFFAGTQEQRVGDNQRRVQQSFGVAEAGAGERLRTWSPDSLNRRPVYGAAAPWDSVLIGPNLPAPGGTGRYGGTTYRTGNAIFLIDVTGQDRGSAAGALGGGAGARQRIGLITRLAPVNFNIRASLTTQGGVAVQGNAQVNGIDQNPWATCDPSTMQNQAGVRDKGGTVVTGGNGMVTGVPPVVNDPTLADSSFTNFGGTTYNDLAARANIQLGPGTYRTEPAFLGGACNKAILTNWGDGDNPTTACGSYFPIIHISGNATLNGIQGQGILLVDGNLEVQGSYQFYGITIIQGDLKTSGGGNTEAHFWGGVMAKNANLDTQNITGTATLNYSSCSILTVLQATSVTQMMRSRGWVQLY